MEDSNVCLSPSGFRAIFFNIKFIYLQYILIDLFNVVRIVVYSLSHVQLFGDPLNCSQAPLSMGFPRQEYWNRLPFSSPRDLPDPGIEPMSPAWQADSLPQRHQGKPKSAMFASIPSFLDFLPV